MCEGSGPPLPEGADGTVDILYLVDRLEELVGTGKRVPFSGRVIIEEGEFLALVDQLRETVPIEIKRAQRVIKEREQIVGAAQIEAQNILKMATERAEEAVSQQGLLSQARVRAEALLQQVEAAHKRSLGEIDVHALKQFGLVEDAMRRGMEMVRESMEEVARGMHEAKNNVGK